MRCKKLINLKCLLNELHLGNQIMIMKCITRYPLTTKN